MTASDHKLVYIAHPIRGDQEGNVERVSEISQEIHFRDDEHIPVAPYIASLQYIDDDKPEEREQGIKKNIEMFERGHMDEVWLFGPELSEGMREEVRLAAEQDIPVKCCSPDLEGELRTFVQEEPIELHDESRLEHRPLS